MGLLNGSDTFTPYIECAAAQATAEIAPGSAEIANSIADRAVEVDSWRYQEAAAVALREFESLYGTELQLIQLLKESDHLAVIKEVSITLTKAGWQYSNLAADRATELLRHECQHRTADIMLFDVLISNAAYAGQAIPVLETFLDDPDWQYDAQKAIDEIMAHLP